MYDKIHPQAGIDRLCLNGKEGGRGLLQFEGEGVCYNLKGKEFVTI